MMAPSGIRGLTKADDQGKNFAETFLAGKLPYFYGRSWQQVTYPHTRIREST
jgi:hypothetical protein